MPLSSTTPYAPSKYSRSVQTEGSTTDSVSSSSFTPNCWERSRPTCLPQPATDYFTHSMSRPGSTDTSIRAIRRNRSGVPHNRAQAVTPESTTETIPYLTPTGRSPIPTISIPLLQLLRHPPFQTLNPPLQTLNPPPSPTEPISRSSSSSSLANRPLADPRLLDHLSHRLLPTEEAPTLLERASQATKKATVQIKKTLSRLLAKAKNAKKQKSPQIPTPPLPSTPHPLLHVQPGRRPDRPFHRPLTIHENPRYQRKPIPRRLSHPSK